MELFESCFGEVSELFEEGGGAFYFEVVVGFEAGDLVPTFVFLQLEDLLEHVGAVFVSELEEFGEFALGYDDGSLEVVVGESCDFFCGGGFDG